MIIWSGRGILTPLILILFIVLMTFISTSLFTAESAIYSMAVAFILAGASNWYLGKKWNNAPGRIVVDEATGERIELKSNHTLFWIKMEYWGVIFGVIGVMQFFAALV